MERGEEVKVKKKKIFRETRRGEKSPGERRGKEKMLHVIKGGGGGEKV